MGQDDWAQGSKARVLLVDDHPVVREGIARLINQQDDLEVCGEADDVNDALDAVGALGPDLAIVDLSLKGGSGIDLIRDIKARFSDVNVLVLSMHDETFYAERALHAGALGYVMKEKPGGEILRAVRRVLSGKICVSDAVAERMLERVGKGPAGADTSPGYSVSVKRVGDNMPASMAQNYCYDNTADEIWLK